MNPCLECSYFMNECDGEGLCIYDDEEDEDEEDDDSFLDDYIYVSDRDWRSTQ